MNTNETIKTVTKLAKSKSILSMLRYEFVRNIYIHKIAKKTYFNESGSLFFIRLNHNKYIKTIIAIAKTIEINHQLKLSHKIIIIGASNM